MDNYSIAPILILLLAIITNIFVVIKILKKSDYELKQIKEELIEIKKSINK